MKLSEEIRLGALLGKQIYHEAFGPDDSSCAFGAAMIAHGGLVVRGENGKWKHNSKLLNVKFIWPWLRNAYVDCPACGERQGVGCIVHLNDYHYWTREQIADFVATIEPKELPEIIIEETDARNDNRQKHEMVA